MTLRAVPAAVGVALLAGACATQPHWPDDPSACTVDALGRGEVVVDVRHHGKARRALAWVPPEAPPPWDLAIVLHEFRSDPRRQLAYSGWVPWGPEHGVLTVAPDGVSSTWNLGGCCGRSAEKRTDDVGFLDALVARLSDSGCLTGRVLATGIGNGGMMAETWAWRSDVPDAVVSVGGALQDTTPAPEGARPVPVLHYRGTADGFIPLDGHPGRMPGGIRGGGTVPLGVAHHAWTVRNHASPEVHAHGEGPLACLARDGDAPTLLCLIDGAEDTWPGAEHARLDITHPLADATAGGMQWARTVWSRRGSD